MAMARTERRWAIPAGWRMWFAGAPFWAAAGMLSLAAAHLPVPRTAVPALAGALFGTGVALSLGVRPWRFGGLAPFAWAATVSLFALVAEVLDGWTALTVALFAAGALGAALFPGILYRRHGRLRELWRDLPLWALAVLLPWLLMPWVVGLFPAQAVGGEAFFEPWVPVLSVVLAGSAGFLVTWPRLDAEGLIGRA